MAHIAKSDLLFSHTLWLKGSQVNINAFGLAQRVSEKGVLGLASADRPLASS